MAELEDFERQPLPDVTIIQEVYDGENSTEMFENELDRSLEFGCSTIIIEPARLGEDTARWIAVGNCLHKTAVLGGFGSVLTGCVWPDKLYICCPLGAISLFCAGLYTVSWQTDPCCKYQVETDKEKLAQLTMENLTLSASPVVLVRRDDKRRKMLHSALALVAAGTCLWKLYKAYE